jgi:hypothetical protein
MKKALFLMLAVVLPAAALFPQGAPQNFSIDRAAQYYLGTSDELLIPVNIWGFVQKPGQYMVPDNTDLVALLSFAGGPNENARLNEIRIIRNDPKRGNLVYKIDVKKFVETADQRLIPTLRPGDTIIVNGTTFHWISKFFDFVSKLAILVQFYYMFMMADYYNNR